MPNLETVVILHGWKWEGDTQVHILDYPWGTEPDGWCVYVRQELDDTGLFDSDCETDFDTYEVASLYANEMAANLRCSVFED